MSISFTVDPRQLRTSLGSRREETNLDFLLAELVSEPSDSFPGTAADRVSIRIEVINEVDFASGVNGNLVARANAQSRIVVRTKVHETFAGRRISLFIDCAGDWKLRRESLRHREKVGIGDVAENGVVDIDSRCLCSRGDIGAGGGRDSVLDVRPRHRVSVVRLDVEHDGHNIQLKPEPGTKVRRLDR